MNDYLPSFTNSLIVYSLFLVLNKISFNFYDAFEKFTVCKSIFF